MKVLFFSIFQESFDVILVEPGVKDYIRQHNPNLSTKGDDIRKLLKKGERQGVLIGMDMQVLTNLVKNMRKGR